jgi:hypothetical protein
MRKVTRLVGAVLLVAVGVRLLDWLVSPAVPLLITVLVLAGIWSAVVGGRGR